MHSLAAEDSLGKEVDLKSVSNEMLQLEQTISKRLARQAIEKMHGETIDLLFNSLETHKFRRILNQSKAQCTPTNCSRLSIYHTNHAYQKRKAEFCAFDLQT